MALDLAQRLVECAASCTVTVDGGAGGGTWTLVLGLLAAVVATGTLVQRTRADARTAWWKQVEWAIDKALGSSPDEQVVGLQALITLTDDVTERPFWSRLSDRDARLLNVVGAFLLDAEEEGAEDDEHDSGADDVGAPAGGGGGGGGAGAEDGPDPGQP